MLYRCSGLFGSNPPPYAYWEQEVSGDPDEDDGMIASLPSWQIPISRGKVRLCDSVVNED